MYADAVEIRGKFWDTQYIVYILNIHTICGRNERYKGGREGKKGIQEKRKERKENIGRREGKKGIQEEGNERKVYRRKKWKER